MTRPDAERLTELAAKDHEKELFVKALRILRNREDAEEEVYEALSRYYEALLDNQAIDSPRAWLLRVVSHLAIDRMRARAARPTVQDHPAEGGESVLDRVAAPGQAPDEEVASRELRANAEQQLAAADPSGQLFELWKARDENGVTLREIGESHGLTPSQVDHRVTKARGLLADWWFGPSGA